VAPQRDEIFKQKVNDCVQHIILQKFTYFHGMEFSEYLQWDRMAHWPRFLRHLYSALFDHVASHHWCQYWPRSFANYCFTLSSPSSFCSQSSLLILSVHAIFCLFFALCHSTCVLCLIFPKLNNDDLLDLRSRLFANNRQKYETDKHIYVPG